MMKNKFKIITAILSCLLLIGATVGICVSAEDATPTVSIYKRNLNYDAAVEIVYAVDAQNLGDNSVKVAFSYDDSKSAPAVGEALDESAYEYVKSQDGTITLDGKTYCQVFSNGFAPVYMSKPIYATPVIVDASNKVVAAGEADRFSIVDYCLARFDDENLSDDQQSLYKALTAYGASVQEALLGNGYTQEELDEYGYADAYYVTKITNNVDDTVTYKRYRESEVTLEAPKTWGGKIFNGFADVDGNVLTMYGAENTASSWNYYDATLEIGENEFVYNYGATGKVQTWTDADGNDLSLYTSGLITPDNNYNSTIDEKNETLLSVYTQNGELILDAPSTSPATWRPMTLMNKNGTAGAVGKTYVFESDFMLDFDPADFVGNDATIAYFGMVPDSYGATGNTFVIFPVVWTSKNTSGNTYTIRTYDYSVSDQNLASDLVFGKWYNLRIEYTIKTLGTTSTTAANSTATGTIKLYIDGKLMATRDVSGYYDNINNKAFAGLGIEDRHLGFGDHEFYFDNTYLATED